MVDSSMHVAIIGAGLAGLTLAHALHDHGIAFDVYDARKATESLAESKNTTVLCTPNTLRVLDYTGAYDKLLPLGYSADVVSILNKDLDLLSEVSVGSSQLYGYSSLRVPRDLIVDTLRRLLIEKGAGHCLHWNARFQAVIADGPAGVEFQLTDGSTHNTSLLVGADGIYSRVRSYITDTVASYTGVLAPIAVLDGPPPTPKNRKSLRLPGMINCTQGGFVISPQGSGGETLCFRHIHGFPNLGRKGWEELARDSKSLLEILRRDIEKWPEYVQDVMKLASAESMTFWPFHQMPDLPKWHSPTASVILIGDAAHAVPPSSAQGAAQAVEDGFSLGMVLAAAQRNGLDFLDTLEAWQVKRMERIRLVQAVAEAGIASKLDDEEQRRLDAGQGFSVERLLSQLFGYDLRRDYDAWISERVRLAG